MSFYKFIVNAIKSNPYNMLINYSLLFIQMQAKNIDTLKFSLSLLHKLKNYESIDINNRLINIGISSITSKQLKLLIQIQSSNDPSPQLEMLYEIEKKMQVLNKEGESNQQEAQVNRMIELKIKVLVLMKEMRSNDANLSVITAHQLYMMIRSTEDMRYVLDLLFRVKSLALLERINVHKIDTAKLDQKQKEMLMYMLVLIKFHQYPAQAKDILATHLNNKYSKGYIEKDKKAVLSVIKIFLQKEKELLQKKKPLMVEESSHNVINIETTKKQIRNKFNTEYKIDLQQPKEQCQQQIAALNQTSYLLAYPLFNYYHQTNQNVICDLQITKINKKISNPRATLNGSAIRSASKSKLKVNCMKNKEQQSNYLRASAKYAQDCAKNCIKGEYFVKHNFNNLNSSLKYVIFNKDKLLWGKNKTEIVQDSTKVKIKNIVGILYGRVSSRLQQSRESGLCFSFLMKDRTVDLSIAKEKEALRRFVMGANQLIRSYHLAQREKWRGEKEIKKGEKQIQQINSKLDYHEYKIRQITPGKLLWRDLFSSLASKTNRYEAQLFPKSKLLIHFASEQRKSENKAFSHSETKKITF